MSWKRYSNPKKKKKTEEGGLAITVLGGTGSVKGPASAKLFPIHPDVYVGSPNLLNVMAHYNTMDLDLVNGPLDILAEFTTQKNKSNNTSL